MSATEANSGQLEAALRRRIQLHATGSFRLGAGRSQVQILSPRSHERPASAGLSVIREPAPRGSRGLNGVSSLQTGANFKRRPLWGPWRDLAAPGQLYVKWGAYYGRWTSPDGRRVNRRIGKIRARGESDGLTRTEAERGCDD